MRSPARARGRRARRRSARAPSGRPRRRAPLSASSAGRRRDDVALDALELVLGEEERDPARLALAVLALAPVHVVPAIRVEDVVDHRRAHPEPIPLARYAALDPP